MTQLFANNAYSVLASAIITTDTTVTLAAGTGSRFPTPTGGDFFEATLIGLDANGNETSWEVVKCTARAGDALTVVRAIDGSTAAGWASATHIEMRAAAGLFGRLATKAASGANSDITSLSGLTSINGGPFAGLRNALINPEMAVDRRNNGASQTFTAAAALAYCVDRWYGYCTGANATGQRVAGSGNSQYRYQFTGAASVTGIGFGQRVEAANAYRFAGTTATLAIDLANSLLTTVTWTAYYANSADSFGSLASPTRTQIATGTFTVNPTVARYFAQIAVPAAATTGVEIVFSVGAQTSGTWTIGRAALLPSGTNEAYAEPRPIGLELALCQRYLPVLDGGAGASNFVMVGQVYTATDVFYPFRFPVEARVAPTGLIATPSQWRPGDAGMSGLSVFSNIAFRDASSQYVNFQGTNSGGLVAGNASVLWCVTANAKILFTGCEL